MNQSRLPKFFVLAAVAISVLGLGLYAVAQDDATNQQTGGDFVFPRGELVIETASGPLRFNVEIARSRDQRSRT